jgi:hypothetical protein
MKRGIAVLLLMAMVMGMPAVATDGPAVEYLNGTAPGVKEGSMGTLNTTLATALEFRAGGAEFSIPYAGVKFYRYREEKRFRLGVLPAIAVGLVKARAQRHLVTISWKDETGVAELVTLEASKDDALGLVALLRARAPRACAAKMGPSCVPPE